MSTTVTDQLRAAQDTIDALDPSAKVQRVALATMFDTWDGHTAYDLGPHLTCGEVEALADVFRAFGQTMLAETLIDGHAEDDDMGDRHRCAECEAILTNPDADCPTDPSHTTQDEDED